MPRIEINSLVSENQKLFLISSHHCYNFGKPETVFPGLIYPGLFLQFRNGFTLNSTSSKGSGGAAEAPEVPTGSLLVQHTGDIGRLVRAQRKRQGLRIDDAAAFTHVSVDLLSRLENGKGSVGLEKVLSVLDGLGLCLVVSPRTDPLVRELLRAGASNTDPPQP